jgi:hypothetical protein
MEENNQRMPNRLNQIDQLYGYEEGMPEEEEQKSIAQQLVDAIKQRRQRAFGGIRNTI